MPKRVWVNNVWKDVGQWKSDLEEVTCSRCPDKIKAHIEYRVKSMADALLEKYPRQEWLGYLIGTVDEDDEFFIKDMIIPIQEVDSMSVVVSQYPEDIQDIIGVMHSHHTMSARFSGTDDEFINANHAISIVVSHREWEITGRIKTPCGEAKRVDVEYDIISPPMDGMEEFLEVAGKNVKEKTFGGQIGYVGRGYGAGYYGGGDGWGCDVKKKLWLRELNIEDMSDEKLAECVHVGQVVMDTFTDEELEAIKQLAMVRSSEDYDSDVTKDVLDNNDIKKLGDGIGKIKKVVVYKRGDRYYLRDEDSTLDVEIFNSPSVGDIFRHPCTNEFVDVEDVLELAVAYKEAKALSEEVK